LIGVDRRLKAVLANDCQLAKFGLSLAKKGQNLQNLPSFQRDRIGRSVWVSWRV